jgi:hypothetical protein
MCAFDVCKEGLAFGAAQFSFAPHPVVRQADLPEALLSIITDSHFRRSRLDERSAEDTIAKISRQAAANQPILFSLPFGGYKSWRVASAPQPDWAEVFSLNYLSTYMLHVAASYRPGARIDFTYCSGVIDRMSNMPLRYSTEYLLSFSALLAVFNSLLPERVRFGLVDITSFYTRDELEAELSKNLELNRGLWSEQSRSAERERKIRSAERNLMRHGIQDLSSLAPSDFAHRCQESAMWCDAVDSLHKRRGFNKYGERIQLVFVRGPTPSIHIGSCETAAFHFWVGTGVAEIAAKATTAATVRQRIISQGAFEQLTGGNSIVEYVRIPIEGSSIVLPDLPVVFVPAASG